MFNQQNGLGREDLEDWNKTKIKEREREREREREEIIDSLRSWWFLASRIDIYPEAKEKGKNCSRSILAGLNRGAIVILDRNLCVRKSEKMVPTRESVLNESKTIRLIHWFSQWSSIVPKLDADFSATAPEFLEWRAPTKEEGKIPSVDWKWWKNFTKIHPEFRESRSMI